MTATEEILFDDVLASLDRETTVLLERVLEIFLDFDFFDHRLFAGSTGGEAITHLSREADRMADQIAAATGQELPRVDPERDWNLVQGGGLRPGAVLVHDVHESAERLRTAIAGVADWREVSDEIRELAARRLLQVVVHDVDLGRRWETVPQEDAEVIVGVLPTVLADELGAVRIQMVSDDAQTRVSKDDGGTVVSGSARVLIAWATGRPGGLDLPADLPALAPRIWI